jgi:hypothetical protein
MKFKKAYKLRNREALFTAFGVKMKRVRVTEICFKKSCDEVCIGEHLFGPLPTENDQ